METLPLPLDGLADAFDEFRVCEPHEIAAMLRRLLIANVTLQLHGAGGRDTAVTLWSADAERRATCFAVDLDDPDLPAVLESRAVIAVGYLDSIKVQFDCEDLVLVRGPMSSVVTCAYPAELFRFQRRSAYRVRPPVRTTPIVVLRHTDFADMHLTLRLLDLSIGGCALFLPEDVPPMQIGGVMNQVRIELDEQTRFAVDLRLQHVTALSGDIGGVRLGCEFVRPDATTQRQLQRFIDHAQKRGRLLTLD